MVLQLLQYLHQLFLPNNLQILMPIIILPHQLFFYLLNIRVAGAYKYAKIYVPLSLKNVFAIPSNFVFTNLRSPVLSHNSITN